MTVTPSDAKSASESPTITADQAVRQLEALQANVSKVLLGKELPVRLTLTALVASGHVLVEDAPGVGKTSLAKAVARSVDCQFVRLQFTPDMLPSDILGSNVYRPNLGEFEFREGPIFTNVLLADEINRTTPRTQSALLEAMSEGQVSVEGNTYKLPPPFFVLATQNPFEFEGTYPLPENQLDRFMIRVSIGYPDRNVEKSVLEDHRSGEPVDRLEAVLSGDEMRQIQMLARTVRVDDSLNDYILDLVQATRDHDELRLGVSPRGTLTLYRAAQGYALLNGRDYVIPDDIKDLAIPVFAHRIMPRSHLRDGQRARCEQVIDQILAETAVPS